MASQTFAVREALEATDALWEAVGRLVPQLSSGKSVSYDELAEIVSASGTHLLVAENEAGEILGCLCLVLFRIPTGIRARIEDVIVDEGARGAGVARELNLAAMRIAKEAGSSTVDLTSSPGREAANQLYLSLGFERRNTNVYRVRL